MYGFLKWALASAFMAGILASPYDALTAARGAMETWYMSVAPVLFPFAALMPVLTSPEASSVYDRILGRMLTRLFALPGRTASAAVIGLIAGSPAGAMAVARVARQEKLTPRQAAQLAGLACGVSPAYVISGVGAALLGSPAMGWRLAGAQVVSLILCGVVFRISIIEGTADYHASQTNSEGGISKAVSTVLMVCGYMIMFSVGSAVVMRFAGEGIWAVTAFCDLPTGVVMAAERQASPVFIAALVGFGGLCIGAQNMSLLSGVGVSWADYVIRKTFSSVVCAGVFVATERLSGFPVSDIVKGREYELAMLAAGVLMVPVVIIIIQKRLPKSIS